MCRAISLPWSQVKERRRISGSSSILFGQRVGDACRRCGRRADAAASRSGWCARPEWRSPSRMAVLPMIRSPSQSPGMARSSASMGRSADDDHVLDPAPLIDHVRTCGLRARATSAQAFDQLGPQLAAEPGRKSLVDRLVGHAHLRIVGEIQCGREMLRVGGEIRTLTARAAARGRFRFPVDGHPPAWDSRSPSPADGRNRHLGSHRAGTRSRRRADHRDGPPAVRPGRQGWTKTEYRQGDITERDAGRPLVADADVVDPPGLHHHGIARGERPGQSRRHPQCVRGDSGGAAPAPAGVHVVGGGVRLSLRQPAPDHRGGTAARFARALLLRTEGRLRGRAARHRRRLRARGLRAAAVHRRRAEGAPRWPT